MLTPRPRHLVCALGLLASLSLVAACDDGPASTDDLIDDAVADANRDTGSDATTNPPDATGPIDTTTSPTDVTGPVDADDIADALPPTNACGGTDSLMLGGEAATPGDPCGECTDGTVVCEGADRVQCAGASVPDACGVCSGRSEVAGAACGVCGNGEWQCAPEGLTCLDDDPLNACGGCATLSDALMAPCVDGTAPGVWRCANPDVIECVVDGSNVCGGSDPLSEEVGQPCGQCATGALECVGDTLECAGDGPRNGCGGCNDLPRLGNACDDCGGTWTCNPDDPDGLRCTGGDADACGACTGASGMPGDVCDDGGTPGALACVVGSGLQCVTSPDNGCGGTTPLTATPGDGCGTCGDGTIACAGLDAVACIGASAQNACGGCGELPYGVGERCGPTGFSWACGAQGSLECVPDDGNAVVALTIEPAATSVEVGATVQLAATAAWADGSMTDATSTAVWSSLDPTFADASAGLVSGLAEGSATIAANLNGLTANATVTVTPDTSMPTLTSVEVTPSMTTIAFDGTVALTATANYDDGSAVDVTATAAWSSADTGVAAVDTSGVVTAVAPGTIDVTATFDGLSDAATITVDPRVPVSLAVSPGLAFVGVGGTAMFTATATYADASTADVTGEATWSSDDMSVVTIAAGTASGVSDGVATITVDLLGASDQATVDVGPVVTGLVADLTTIESTVGARVRPMVAATFSDNSMANVTVEMAWLPVNAVVAEGQADGWIALLEPGSTALSAEYRGQSVTVNVDVDAIDFYRRGHDVHHTFLPAVQDFYRRSSSVHHTFLPAVQDFYRRDSDAHLVTWQ